MALAAIILVPLLLLAGLAAFLFQFRFQLDLQYPGPPRGLIAWSFLGLRREYPVGQKSLETGTGSTRGPDQAGTKPRLPAPAHLSLQTAQPGAEPEKKLPAPPVPEAPRGVK